MSQTLKPNTHDSKQKWKTTESATSARNWNLRVLLLPFVIWLAKKSLLFKLNTAHFQMFRFSHERSKLCKETHYYKQIIWLRIFCLTRKGNIAQNENDFLSSNFSFELSFCWSFIFILVLDTLALPQRWYQQSSNSF